MAEEGTTYDAAGVSLATANAVVERLREAVESTGAQGFGHFAALHPLFETFAVSLANFNDSIAERAVTLGGQAYGTARHVAANSRIPAKPATRSAMADIAGHRYQPKVWCSGVSSGHSYMRERNMRP